MEGTGKEEIENNKNVQTAKDSTTELQPKVGHS